MSGVDTVGAINTKLVGSQLFDELADFSCPFDWDVFVTEVETAELVTRLVTNDGRVLGVGKASVGIYVRQKMLNVGLEIIDNRGVGVELHRFWRERRFVSCYVVAGET